METVFVTLQPGAGYRLAGQGSGLVTILDNELTSTAAPPTSGTVKYVVFAQPGSVLQVVNAVTRELAFTVTAFPGFAGRVNVAVGDVNGDGVDDVVAAVAASGPSHVKVFSGADASTLASFFAFDGGVNVAVGDIDGDLRGDLIVGAGPGAGPHVKVFSGADFGLLRSFSAYGAGFSGGVTVGAGDADGNGRADLITGTQTSSSHVKVFQGDSLRELSSFFAYPGFTGGVLVAGGDADNDGLAEVATGAFGVPHVKVFDPLAAVERASFLAFESGAGARVRLTDLDDDGVASLLLSRAATEAPAGSPTLLILDALTQEQRDALFASGLGF